MKNIRKLNSLAIIIIAIIITVVIAVIGYQSQKTVEETRDENSQIEENENQLAKDDVTKDESVDENVLETYEEWNTYNNDEYDVTFKYPSDWELTESVNKDADSLRVIVKKDGYEFDIYIVTGSPEICEFSTGNFEELSTDDKQYRIQYQAEFNQYVVCMKDTASQLYTTLTDTGYIYYHVPRNPEKSYLDILNKILLSRS